MLLLLIVCLSVSVRPLWCQIAFGGATDDNPDTKAPLNIAQALGEDAVNTRFNFDQVTTRNHGSSCTTPNGEPGVCAFIGDSECRSILRRIQRRGVTRRILTFLRQAIQSPCGFEQTDYTLCCKSNSRPTTRPTRPPVTEPTTRPTTQRPTEAPSTRCGVSPFSVRIVGGKESVAGSWPWAAILGSPSGSRFNVVCGGSLIDDTHILTAAHCFPGGSNSRITHVRLGDHDISRTSDTRVTPLTVRVSSVKVHENYNSNTLKNDIAIVTLSQSVRFTTQVTPICLPRGTRGADLTNLREKPIIIGWGSLVTGGATQNSLHEAALEIVPSSECRTAYRRINNRDINIGDRDQICGGRGQTDSCTGDSGGAMMVSSGGAFEVVGITSFGVECGRPDFPGVYTRVDNFLQWINVNT